MCRHFDLVVVKIFKSNDRAAIEQGTVECEYHIYMALRFLRSELYCAADNNGILAKKRFTGILVHQDSCQGIGLSRKEIVIGNRIHQSNLRSLRSYMCTCSFSNQSCLDAREVHSLIHIRDVLMGNNENVLVIEKFKSYQYGIISYFTSQIELNFHFSVSRFGCEGYTGRDLFSILIFQGFTSLLVHELTCYSVLKTRNQILVCHDIDELYISVCSYMITGILVCKSCMQIRNINGLSFILQIKMDTDPLFRLFVSDLFSSHDCHVSGYFRVDFKRNFYCTGCFFRYKCHGTCNSFAVFVFDGFACLLVIEGTGHDIAFAYVKAVILDCIDESNCLSNDRHMFLCFLVSQSSANDRIVIQEFSGNTLYDFPLHIVDRHISLCRSQ